MFHWIDATANAIGPLGTIFGFILTIVGLIVYFRKWLKSIARDASESARQSTDAANSAREAGEHAQAAGAAADVAGKHAMAASATSVDTNKAMEWLVTELVAKDEALAESLLAREYLKERVDTAVAAVAYQAAERHGVAAQDDDLRETELITITGRHRLHYKEATE